MMSFISLGPWWLISSQFAIKFAVCHQFLERSYCLSDVFFPACTCRIQNIQHDLWHFWQTPLLGCHRLLQTRPGCNVYHYTLHPKSAKLQILWQNRVGMRQHRLVCAKRTNNKWYSGTAVQFIINPLCMAALVKQKVINVNLEFNRLRTVNIEFRDDDKAPREPEAWRHWSIYPGCG